MTKIEPRTLKGFRDFLPKDARRRAYVLETLKRVFESYGFEPLETPVLEYEDILAGKYGDEGDKLMYRFTDNGDRKVAMRYDQTVPLARVVAQYQNKLPTPFKRYQIQNVWRAENTQRGRYREFVQCDIDTVGLPSLKVDAEIIACSLAAIKKLGFKNVKILINDRSIFKDLKPTIVSAIDKWDKIGKDGVLKELINKGYASLDAEKLLNNFNDAEPTPNTQSLFNFLKAYEIEKDKEIFFNSRLARGLDYYTSTIVEIVSDDYPFGSLGGGGRYDNLIGMFAGKDIPAVGFAFGFDRLVEAMEVLNLFPTNLFTSKVLVAFAKSELQEKALKVADELRNKKINCEAYLEDVNLEKQLKYADKKQIPFVVIVDEDKLILKDMTKRSQEELTLDQILKQLS
jgi:histidyl-tRNA synthetase